MREFGVEVTTAELVTLERALRDAGSPEAWSALAKGHLGTPGLTLTEFGAVIAAAQQALEVPPDGAGREWGTGLTRLIARMEHDQRTAEAAPVAAAQARRRAPRKSA